MPTWEESIRWALGMTGLVLGIVVLVCFGLGGKDVLQGSVQRNDFELITEDLGIAWPTNPDEEICLFRANPGSLEREWKSCEPQAKKLELIGPDEVRGCHVQVEILEDFETALWTARLCSP